MSEKECLAGDWYGAGLEDGREGRLERAFDERAARCSEFGARADGEAYFAGREEALAALCTDRGGYNYGLAGKSYMGVCAPEAERDFLSGYLAGWRIHRAEEARESADDAYGRALSLVENYREDIRRARRKLRDDETTEEEIARARKSIDRARDQLPYAERRADELLYELGRADEALAQTYETTAAYRQSEEFIRNRNALAGAFTFARSEQAIDFCTDYQEDYSLTCMLRSDAVIFDVLTGEACALGTGEARLAGQAPRFSDDEPPGLLLFFAIYPVDPVTGRMTSRPVGEGPVVVRVDGYGQYLGTRCSQARLPG